MIGNAFFFNISFKLHTSEWNLEKSEGIENIQNNKGKIKPALCFSEMKLLKFEYTPPNVGLWYIDVLKPLLVLVIKTSKRQERIMSFLTGESYVSMFRI